MGLKARDEFQLSQSWWSKNKPVTLKSTGLGKALGEYETLLKPAEACASKGSYLNLGTGARTPFDIAEEYLRQKLPPAVDDALKECNKTLHADAIAVLKKFKKAWTDELHRLDQLRAKFQAAYDQQAKPLLAQLAQGRTQLAALDDGVGKLVGIATAELAEIRKLEAALAKAAKGGGNPQAAVSLHADALRRLALVADGAAKASKIEQSIREIKDKILAASQDLVNIAAPADATRFKKEQAALGELVSRVRLATTDVQSLHAQAQALVEDMAGHFDGQAPGTGDALATLKDVAKTLKSYGEDGRRLNNNVIALTSEAQTMAKVRQLMRAGKSPDQAYAALGWTLPLDQWSRHARESVAKAQAMQRELAALVQRADDLRRKTAARIGAGQRNDPKVAALLADIDEYVDGELATYTQVTTTKAADLQTALADALRN